VRELGVLLVARGARVNIPDTRVTVNEPAAGRGVDLKMKTFPGISCLQ
jgi:hypothetical protein